MPTTTKITAQHMRDIHGWTIRGSESDDQTTLDAMHQVAIDNNGPCPEQPPAGDFQKPYTFDVMDLDGISVSPVTVVGETYEAAAEVAAAKVTGQGYEVVDVMDSMVIIAPGA